IFKIYGLPKLMELDIIKSPGLTTLVLESADFLTLSSVLLTYFAPLSTSPIFNQFNPSTSRVRNESIGRGDPPRTIVERVPSFVPSHSPASRNSGKRNLGTSACLFFFIALLIGRQPRNL